MTYTILYLPTILKAKNYNTKFFIIMIKEKMFFSFIYRTFFMMDCYKKPNSSANDAPM